MEKILKVGDVIEVEGKRYKAVPEVMEKTCKDLQAQDNQIEKLQQRIENMRVVLQHYLDLLERANNGDAVAECKLFEDIVLIEQVLNKEDV